MSGTIRVPSPINETVRPYAPGDAARTELQTRMAEMASERVDIPVIVGGKEIRTGDTREIRSPHNREQVLGRWHASRPEDIKAGIEASLSAQKDWANWHWEDRAGVFLKAAELLSTKWRPTLNAATMLGQSKNAFQAEIDAACEMIDFFTFNAHFAQQIFDIQPACEKGVWNRTDYRPIEGFVYAISPFNFTAIGGNLAGAPAMMGCGVLWKPSSEAVYSGYYTYKLLEEAGLPPGVINFVPGNPVQTTEIALSHRDFAGLHFTGSTSVFKSMWRTVGERMDTYRAYPRLVGETGGKDFIVAHTSADPDALRTAIIRGAFEYQGQKCSATSRVYVPESVWAKMGSDLADEADSLQMGDPIDFSNYINAVIHRSSFDKISGYIDRAKTSADIEVIAGGSYDDSRGFFVRPTILLSTNPKHESMCEEIFGPVVSIYVYPDNQWSQTLDLVDETSPYALTGAVFSQDRAAVREALERLRFAAGNFYINDKPSGAVVGQQPFGGSRASGTNDKAGSMFNLLRWLSPRSLKETLAPPTDYRYPYLGKDL